MTCKAIYITVCLSFIFCITKAQGPVSPGGSQTKHGEHSIPSQWPDVDYGKLISRADLVYNTPAERSEAGHPVGNGRMGSLVWTIPSSLKFQLNRVDVFGNNSDSDNFFERHTDYCGGIGYVDVDFGEDIFKGPEFRQHLSCHDGLETVDGKAVQASILAWDEADVMAIKVRDRRTSQAPVFTNLRMLRPAIARSGDHSAISKLDIAGDRIVLTQEFREDDYYCGSAVVIGISGRKGKAEITNASTVRLSATPGNDTFTVFMASAASFDPDENIVDKALKKLETAQKQGFEGLYESNRKWWDAYWKRSFVHLSSPDQTADLIERNYNYYLYVMASSSRGDYPVKFNGMLWTTGGDARKWGGLYWGANQSCLYNALFPANRPELMDPMFNMYSRGFESFATAARQQWGSKGIFIPETTGFDGIPALPDDIAEEMRQLYLAEKPWKNRSERFMDYAFTKLPFHSRWNWKKDAGWKDGQWHVTDKGGGPFGHVTHIFSRGAKIAYQYWLKYEYTGDRKWLKDYAYPMLKGVTEFYRNFPNVKKGKDGKYHIYHINDNESVWGAHNTIEEISSMRGILPVVIRASEILGTDAGMRPVWKEFMDHLSPLPLNTGLSEDSVPTSRTWIKGLPPVVQGNPDRSPDPNTMPPWFFDLCTLESGQETLEIANNTFDSYFPDGIDKDTKVNVLSKLPVAGVLLGRTAATRFLIPNQIETTETEVLQNRMDLREGFQATSVQRLGRAAEALHYALCQSVPPGPGQDPVVHLFPAWPKTWNADYTLLCRGGFLVSSAMKDQEVNFVKIRSKAGGTFRLRNPWPERNVIIYRNGEKTGSSRNGLIVLNTEINDRYIVVPEGTHPQELKRSIP
ncbi:glycosyl hydrolase family 95 catalytic domain-containing protein [Sinomicrobium weinanense]|uniref:Glycoside hydrolase n=1 Tax=Sinomicrobium weinanense TaxID=2842200 RepID=A0A926JTZ5_9FLAO|nr:glycoside hydrolase [Sinomicrobium weinanense]MBC9797202.1 glycoside hydrolase [Sinomicrobium weinanense]MBU3122734.1 hypothetical protein [Sinomicrobium weinanense]